MTRGAARSPFVLRYVYTMLAIVIVALAAVVITLYVDLSDDSRTHARVQSFHLESYEESEQLVRDVDALLILIEDASAAEIPDHTGVAGVESVRIGYGGLLDSMRSRLERLGTLQAEYGAELTAESLRRLLERFERLDALLPDSRTADATVSAVASFASTLDQLRRLRVSGKPRVVDAARCFCL